MQENKWRAKEGKWYYNIGWDGKIRHDIDAYNKCNNDDYDSGNYFKTKKQAKVILKYIKAILLGQTCEWIIEATSSTANFKTGCGVYLFSEIKDEGIGYTKCPICNLPIEVIIR